MKASFLLVLTSGYAFALAAEGAEIAIPTANVPSFARLPNDAPLDSVKWTGGFWQDRMRRLRDIHLPGVLDGSFMTVENGSTLRNLLRAARLEQGGALGRAWSDGDCYLVLDVASRLFAHEPDDYLKEKLDYWIPIIEKVQREDGLVDSWTVLKGFDAGEGKVWERFEKRLRKDRFQGLLHYNIGSLHAAATSHRRATGDDRFLKLADRAAHHLISVDHTAADPMQWAAPALYSRKGDRLYLDALEGAYAKNWSPFGPAIRQAPEVFGHNTYTAHYLMGASSVCGFTGDKELLAALGRLADNMLSKKTHITGAVAVVFRGERPEQVVNGKNYPSESIHEAVGAAYDLPNDTAYCESCGQALYTEWYYRMFRLTGDALYMDASERALYNTVPGCVDLDQPNFFYCNPQEQSPGSTRSRTSSAADGWETNYTWKRLYTKQCACCPPKVMRAIALSPEIAYNVNGEGLWVNLYGDNTARVALPEGGTLECRQSSAYPWDGKVRLALEKVESPKPFGVFLRIPGWVSDPVRIAVNGEAVQGDIATGAYHRIERAWKSGDVVELELPMPVRFMAAHPKVAEANGKVAVMRGPVVYCLEGDDVPEGIELQSIRVPAAAELKPELVDELGGVVKLSGSFVCSDGKSVPQDALLVNETESSLYRVARFAHAGKELAEGDRKVTVGLIPYFTRLNRKSDYFRIWLPAY